MMISGKIKRIIAVLLASVIASSALTITAVGAPTESDPDNGSQTDEVKKAEKSSSADFVAFNVTDSVEGVYLKKKDSQKEKLKIINGNYFASSVNSNYCWSPRLKHTDSKGNDYNDIYLTFPTDTDLDINNLEVSVQDEENKNTQCTIKPYTDGILYFAYKSSINVQKITFTYKLDETSLSKELNSDDLINVLVNADIPGSHHISISLDQKNDPTVGPKFNAKAKNEKRYIAIFSDGSKLENGGNILKFNSNDKKWDKKTDDVILKASSDYEEFYTGDTIHLSVEIPESLNLKSDDYSIKYYQVSDGLDIPINADYTIAKDTTALKFKAEITIGKDDNAVTVTPVLDLDDIKNGYPEIKSCDVIKNDVNSLPNILSFGIFSSESMEIKANFSDPGSPSFTKAKINEQDAILNKDDNTISLIVDPSYKWKGKAGNFIKVDFINESNNNEIFSQNVSYQSLTKIENIESDNDEEILVDSNIPYINLFNIEKNGYQEWKNYYPQISSKSGFDFSFEANSEGENITDKSGLKSVSMVLKTQEQHATGQGFINEVEINGQDSAEDGFIKLERIKNDGTDLSSYSTAKTIKDDLKATINFKYLENTLEDGKYTVSILTKNNLGKSKGEIFNFVKDTVGPDIEMKHNGSEGILYNDITYYTPSNSEFLIVVKDGSFTKNSNMSENFSCMVSKDGDLPQKLDNFTINWSWNNGTWEGTVNFQEDGIYEISEIKCSDDLNNLREKTETIKFGIDSKAPEKTVEFTKADGTAEPIIKDNARVYVYDKKVNVKITVKDKTVYKEGLTCSLHKNKPDGDVLNGFTLEPSQMDNNSDEITYEGIIDASDYGNYEGKYYLVIDKIKDSLGNIADKQSYPFYIDVNDPKVDITYSENVSDNLLEKLTFGFYRNDKITVTVKITDAVAGVNKESIKVEGMNKVPQFKDVNNDCKELTFTKTLDKNYAYNIKVTADDLLGRSSSSSYNPSGSEDKGEIAQISSKNANDTCPNISIKKDTGCKKDGITWYSVDVPKDKDTINSEVTVDDIKKNLDVHPGLKSVKFDVYYKAFDKDAYDTEPVNTLIDSGSTDKNVFESGAFTLSYSNQDDQDAEPLKFAEEKITQNKYKISAKKSDLDDGHYKVLVRAENNILDDSDNNLFQTAEYYFVYNSFDPVAKLDPENEKSDYKNENDFKVNGSETSIDFFKDQKYTLTLKGNALTTDDIKEYNYNVSKLVNGKFIDASEDDYTSTSLENTDNGLIATYTFKKDGVYKLEVNSITDVFDHEIINPDPVIFGIDNSAPVVENIVLTPAVGTVANPLNNNGFFDRAVNVNFTVKDQDLTQDLLKGQNFNAVISGSGFEKEIRLNPDWSKNGTEYKATSVIDDSFVAKALNEGKYTVKITKCNDGLGNESHDLKSVSFTIDNTEPKIDISYKKNLTNKILEYLTFGFYSFNDKDDTKRYYQSRRTLTVKVTEHNFYNKDEMLEKFKVSIKDEHGSEVSRDWVKTGNTYTMTYTFIDYKNDPDDGRFDILLPQFKDKANNQAVNGDKKLYSQYKRTFSIDETNPIVNVSYADTSTMEGSHKGYDYYRASSLTATITIVEHNFDYNNADKNFAFKSYCYISSNFTGTDKLDLNGEDWKSRWKHNGNTHTIEIVLQGNTRYNAFAFTTIDLSGRQKDMTSKTKFVIDNTAPVQLAVTYSRNPVAKLVENLTFGLYKANVDITLSATDLVAGIRNIDYAYVGVDNSRSGSSSANYSEYSNSPSHDASITFTVSPQFKGYIQFTVTDY